MLVSVPNLAKLTFLELGDHGKELGGQPPSLVVVQNYENILLTNTSTKVVQ